MTSPPGRHPLRGEAARLALAVLMTGIAVIGLHGGRLAAPFFTDDYLFLEQVRGRSLPQSLASPDPLGNFLRPVSRTVHFWSVSHLAGERPAAFRAVNLLLFLTALALLAWIARRVAGAAAAAVAVAYLGLHYAADVPLLWISGVQDLLALVFALAAIALHASGRSVLAAASLALGLLSKESVALAGAVAVLVARSPREPWRAAVRRAWPLLAVTAAWAVAWLSFALRRGGTVAGGSSVADLAAALAHAVQVAFGLEPRTGGVAWRAETLPLALALLLAAGGVYAVVAVANAEPKPSRRRRGMAIGLAWAVLGALPVTAVAPLWSAYFYLFALCGVALALGAVITGPRRPVWLAPAVIVVVGLLLGNARGLDEFTLQEDRWSRSSHVNRFYIARGMDRVQDFLEDLRRARPVLPPRSTVFYARMPPSIGLQTADGPVLRWAYRDTTLRSHYLMDFRLDKLRRGPVFLFVMEGDSLIDQSDDPQVFASIGYSMVAQERFDGAADALTLALERQPGLLRARYLQVWVDLARGRREDAYRKLNALGFAHRPEPPPDPGHRQSLAARDTLQALERLQEVMAAHILNPRLHAESAEILLAHERTVPDGVVEAFAYRVLAPGDPAAWRLWAGAQLKLPDTDGAIRSLEHYIEIGGPQAAADPDVRRALEALRRVRPGGDLVQEALRR